MNATRVPLQVVHHSLSDRDTYQRWKLRCTNLWEHLFSHHYTCLSNTQFLRNILGLLRQHRSFLWLLPLFELIHHLRHRDPLDALVRVDILDQPLVHEDHVWVARNVWVDGHGEDEGVVLAIEVVEVVFPEGFDCACVDPSWNC